jgi:ABC-type sugar transport system ATPase subunit
MACDPESVLIEVEDLSKSFRGIRALDGARLAVRPGEVHALMGENGAGKSTLMKSLVGLVQPDSGTIRFRGQPVRIPNPHAARQLGISMIHQELMPFRNLSVAENLLMGNEPTRGIPGWVDRQSMLEDSGRRLERLGISMPGTRRMGELSVAEMQGVEIAKALVHQAAVIIMDEPSSALSEREIQALFNIVADLRRNGVAVLYISHKLDEVFRLADTITVMRDGRWVATAPAASYDAARLIRLMVGREAPATARPAATAAGPVALAVSGLSRRGAFRSISFELRQGEVLGLTGLMGAGRTELAEALFGLVPAEAGEVLIHNRPVRIRAPADALAHGLALVAEDRQRYGLIGPMSVEANLTLATVDRCCRWGWIDRHRESAAASSQVTGLGIRCAGPAIPASHLSGGNQQKVALGRMLLAEPDILILDEPTRGIDVGAKAEVHQLIRTLAARGRAVLLISSEMPEVLSLSDRLLVMREGEMVAEIDPRTATPDRILALAMPRRSSGETFPSNPSMNRVFP